MIEAFLKLILVAVVVYGTMLGLSKLGIAMIDVPIPMTTLHFPLFLIACVGMGVIMLVKASVKLG